MSNWRNFFGVVCGCLVVVNALALPAFALNGVGVPEIDAATAGSAIALLIGGSLIALSKIRQK